MDNTSMRKALEAARDLLLPQCNGGTAFAKACGETVNKIMDALKEERTSDCNAAAMREALADSNGLLEELALIEEWSESAREQIAENNAALATPPRNCDVGTEVEKHRRFIGYCNACDCPMGCIHRKQFVGMLDERCASMLKCYIRWAQMPYEKGETDGSK